MIQEAYVSYEIAELLEKKGFDVPCNSWYMPCSDGSVKKFMLAEPVNHNQYDGFLWTVSRPTHQMACAWLREIKNIVIIPEIHTTTDPKDYYWGASIYYLDKPWDLVKWISEPSKGKCEGYDDVIEAALKYTLENLL